ncbi:type III pantothenate kinase [Candidatus Symbiobacter mobilis]|uniref:Type III pantothenate kinase n=1 Tax=Candidatus Symbiobacter mobilis CR TaxID=946483 RepID=U5N7K4_9BURK|nr:type III pantothenate kinase [Candidatus Symbiobacter mobilis]AGX87300.1 type III pantothenate kinase [Candidatus Symbiobacter mobilis CR]
MAFLLVDVGNTRLKWALYAAPRRGASVLAQGVAFLDNIEQLPHGDWLGLPAPTGMLGCCVASDAARRRVAEQMELWEVSAQWVHASTAECGVTNGYDTPNRLGADRWVAMIGAWHRCQADYRPIVVAMVGTAVTVDAIDPQGRFLGGWILPGHGIMLRALQSGTAGLHVPTGTVCDFPTNTSDALTTGGTYAIAASIGRMVSQLAQRFGTQPACIVGGGAAWKVAPSITVPHTLVENLVFEGLLDIAEKRCAHARP